MYVAIKCIFKSLVQVSHFQTIQLETLKSQLETEFLSQLTEFCYNTCHSRQKMWSLLLPVTEVKGPLFKQFYRVWVVSLPLLSL